MLNPLDVGINTGPDRVVTKAMPKQHALLSQVSCLQRVVLQGLEGTPMLPIL